MTLMDQPTTATERLLSTAQVAEQIGISENTLRYWRWDHTGPKWFKLGSAKRSTVRYRASDVQAWLDEQYAAINGQAS